MDNFDDSENHSTDFFSFLTEVQFFLKPAKNGLSAKVLITFQLQSWAGSDKKTAKLRRSRKISYFYFTPRPENIYNENFSNTALFWQISASLSYYF